MNVKTITLKQIGWRVEGRATIYPWGVSEEHWVSMDRSFVPIGYLTKDRLLRCINDGRQGSESIESADLLVCEEYERGVVANCRRLHISKDHGRMRFAKRGV